MDSSAPGAAGKKVGGTGLNLTNVILLFLLVASGGLQVYFTISYQNLLFAQREKAQNPAMSNFGAAHAAKVTQHADLKAKRVTAVAAARNADAVRIVSIQNSDAAEPPQDDDESEVDGQADDVDEEEHGFVLPTVDRKRSKSDSGNAAVKAADKKAKKDLAMSSGKNGGGSQDKKSEGKALGLSRTWGGGSDSDADEGQYDPDKWGKLRTGPSDIVLVSAMFGDSVTKPHLRFFLRSARNCGADVLLVGDPPPPLPLPPNVRHVRLTWQEMWERVQQKVPACTIDPAERAAAPGYKVIDLKPLYGTILEEELRPYKFWGHIDNDMILGDVRKFVLPEVLTHDIVSGLYHKNTWGPFSLFRNVDKVNSIFRRAPDLCDMLNDVKHWGFDEKFGRDGNNMHEIVEKAVTTKALELAVHKGMPVGWDGKDANGYQRCELECPPEEHPGPCKVVRRCRYMVKRRKKRCWVLGSGNEGPEMEVLLCHFQYGKGEVNAALEELSEGELAALERAPILYQDKLSGFSLPPKLSEHAHYPGPDVRRKRGKEEEDDDDD